MSVIRYEWDGETGLDYAESRYYANGLGRFVSADPIIMETKRLADPQSLNLYAYVRNSPLIYVDPNGERFRGEDDEEVVIRRTKVDGKKVWVIKSGNASADLKKLVALINSSGSRKASEMFGRLNKHQTMINLVIDTGPLTNKERASDTATTGLHEPHDKDGPVHFNDVTNQFDGKPDVAAGDKNAYREATITLYEGKLKELGYEGEALDGKLVSIFGHESRHDLDRKQVKAARAGSGSDKIWHPENGGKSPQAVERKIITEIERSKGIRIEPKPK
jgi:RHS repeat-associated protein